MWYNKERNEEGHTIAERMAREGSKKGEVEYKWGCVCDKAEWKRRVREERGGRLSRT